MSSKIYNDSKAKNEDYKKKFLPKTTIVKKSNKGKNSIESNINENRLPNEFNDLSYDSNKEE
jgi:hypothetical protein